MTVKPRTILIGEDDCEVRGYLKVAAQCLGFEAVLAEDGEEVLSFLQQQNDFDAVLLDIVMPRKDGFETLRDIRKLHSSLPVIMVSDASSTVNIVQAIKLGATDFLAKPVSHEELRRVITKVLRDRPAASFGANQPETASASGKLFYGTNARMREIRKILANVASSDAPVLIRGQTGVGKEVIARELHALSPRARKPFLKLNCAALPSELVESELFGYERGAFTGAFQRKAGMFEMANGGTILLDEIGDMDFKLQAKLLQVLQDQEFQRIGGKETIQVDVQVMAATHQDLEQAIINRQFREDLYYRLNVISIEIPPLRERKEDLVSMAEFLIRKYSPSAQITLNHSMKTALMEYDWPGNIRELENAMRRFLILRDEDTIIRELQSKMARRDLSRMVRSSDPTPIAVAEEKPILTQVHKAKQQAEINAILTALNNTRWNRKQAAVMLKIDYKALLYKMKILGISDGNAKSFPEASMAG
jgi:two-component system, NtrC family, response regulator AtoC